MTTKLPQPLRGAAPSHKDVLAQAINFDPDRWRRLLPDRALWPDALDDRPRVSKWPQVDRATVLQIGAQADDPLGALRLYVASSVWGAGTRARSVHRQIQVLVDTPPDVVGSRLQAAIRVLRSEGAIAAFAALRTGSGRIHGLGPSFFTKVLYFASAAAGDYQPLILDRFVVASLNRAGVTDWPPSMWTTDQYGRYLAWAHEWATAWDGGVTADVVEYQLFADGKTGG